jgi:arylsulfatase A-like enzyme
MVRFSLLAVLALGFAMRLAAADRPNVVVIYADDLGFADLGATGCTDVPTPHIDSLAKNGCRFTDSYVTACVCSPSRAGLLTGRYQQRFGFDANAEGQAKADRAPRALDLKQVTFAQRLREAGYATGLVGKWHLGAGNGYLPTQRGFDEFYGLLPHGIGAAKAAEDVPVYRGTTKVATPDDHTVAFGKEAEAFVGRHKERPFFLYLAFTAVHAPHVAPAAYLKKFEGIADKRRQRYAAMIACLDDAVGGVLAKLREHGLEEKTLIFFSTDNGGPVNGHARNDPYTGGKWSLWEGGIRSPIFVQWRGRLPAGRVVPHMVTQLDFLPTALAAAGVEPSPDWKLDGVNLLPVLEREAEAAPHEALFWRFGVQYAVRKGHWKLLKPSVKEAPKLFDLAADPGEKADLAAKHPERVKELQAMWDAWNARNEPPRWTDERWNGLEERKARKAGK